MNDIAYEAMSSLTIGGEADTYSVPGGPPQQSNQSTTRSAQTLSMINPYGTRTEIPDAISKSGTQNSVITSSSNSENIKSLSSALGEGWNTVYGKRPAPGIAYNAWDNSGEMHKQVRVPSTTTGAASNPALSSSRSTPVSSGRSAWAKPVSAIHFSYST